MRKKLLQSCQRRRCRTANSNHSFPRTLNLVEDLEIVDPEQVWVCDITYIRFRREFVFLALNMDVYTCAIRGWNLGRSLDVILTLAALHQTLQDCVPEFHRGDQDIRYGT
jgi:transposase InsO family protein